MEFNKRKFNIIVAFTICLMCFIVGFSSLAIVTMDNNEIIDNTNAESGNEDNEGKEDLPEDLSDDTSSGTEVPVKTDIKTAPIFNSSKKYVCLNYALSNLSKYSYKTTLTQNVISAGQTQKITKYIYVCGEKSYSKTISSGYYNFKDYGYVESETSIKTKRDNGSVNTTSYANYITEYGFSLDQLPYVLNQSTCTIDKFNDDKLLDYYELSITLKDSAYKDYLVAIEANAPGQNNPKVSSISLTLIIDKEYGIIKSIKAKENYKITISIAGISGEVSCASTVAYRFDYKNYSNSSDVKEIKTALGI